MLRRQRKIEIVWFNRFIFMMVLELIETFLTSVWRQEFLSLTKGLWIFTIKLILSCWFQLLTEWKSIWSEELLKLFGLMFYLNQSYGVKRKPFLMEFPQKKKVGIKWSRATFRQNFTLSCLECKKRSQRCQTWLKNSREYNLCAFNPSFTVSTILESLTITVKCSNTIGYQVGQERKNLQQEFLVFMLRAKLTTVDLLLFPLS